MAAQGVGEFGAGDEAVLIEIKMGPNRFENFGGKLFDSRDRSILARRDQLVLSGNCRKFAVASFSDVFPNGLAGCRNFLRGDRAIFIGVDRLSFFLSQIAAEIADGLAFFFVNLIVIVGIETLKKLRQITVSEGARPQPGPSRDQGGSEKYDE